MGGVADKHGEDTGQPGRAIDPECVVAGCGRRPAVLDAMCPEHENASFQHEEAAFKRRSDRHGGGD
jgi:hypothetical protein